jgi:hypothetical protein
VKYDWGQVSTLAVTETCRSDANVVIGSGAGFGMLSLKKQFESEREHKEIRKGELGKADPQVSL